MAMSMRDQSNVDMIDRQIEVNEWTYSDKMETLFILQILFIGLLVASLFVILSKYGFFDIRFVYLIMAIIVIVVFLVWFFKNTFTRNVRDRRFWNKRQFAGDSKLAPVVAPGEVSAAAKELINICSTSASGGSSNCVS